MGPPKSTPSKQANTLFSYFAKSPIPTQNIDATQKTPKEVLSLKKSPNEAKTTQKVPAAKGGSCHVQK